MPSIMITSVNRGLGLEFARQYAADGWHVLAACRNPDTAAELQAPARTGCVTILPWMSPIHIASGGLKRISLAKRSMFWSTVLACSAGKIRKPAMSITSPGKRCSTSMRWGRCASPRPSSTRSHAANVSSSLRSAAA